jgi:hypothetical protein
MIIALGQAGTPPINVTVSSGSSWLTTVIAVLGLVLASLSLGWQFFSWRWSGSRVTVETTFGVALSEHQVFFLPNHEPSILAATVAEDWPEVMVIANIRNTGRLPVTIQRCSWYVGGNVWMAVDVPPGVSLPYRLGEHDQCFSIVALQEIVEFSDRNPPLPGWRREVWPLIDIANRRRPVRGNALSVPAHLPLPKSGPKAEGQQGRAGD